MSGGDDTPRIVRVTTLGPHFDVDEFACNDGTDVPDVYAGNLLQLVSTVLEPLRERWGYALIVVSGYRTRKHNLAVGGAGMSTHLTCEGCDIRPVQLTDVRRLYDMAMGMHAAGDLPGHGGIGVYPRWIHVDTRKAPDGHLRKWSGGRMGTEPAS